MTEQQAADLLVVLVTAWPDGMRWHDERQQAAIRRLYTRCLVDLDYAAADAAVMRLVATWKPTNAQRWPTIAELREAITAQQTGRRALGGEVWGAVRRLCAQHGAHRAPGVDFAVPDPLVAAVVHEMGWRELCLTEDQTATRARVIELAEQLAAREVGDRAVGKLAPPVPARRLAAPEPQPLAGILAGMLPDKGKEQP